MWKTTRPWRTVLVLRYRVNRPVRHLNRSITLPSGQGAHRERTPTRLVGPLRSQTGRAEAHRAERDGPYGDVWERPGLSKRDRSLITVAALTALYRGDQLTGHLERALANGVTREEIGELITHLAFYAGWPAAMTAGRIARKVFDATKP